MYIFRYPSQSISTGPIEFMLDGSSTQVSQDTVTPANSIPLPTTWLDPSGVPVDPTDLNQEVTQQLVLTELQSVNTELDAQTVLLTQIDADTGNIATNTANTVTELQSVNTELDSQTALLTTIDADTGAISTNTANTVTELQSVNTELDSQTALLTTIDADTSAISTNTANTVTELQSVNTELDSQTALLTTIDADTGNIATSTSSIDGKLANNYGVATGALRTAAQIGNVNGEADFGSGAAGAQTLRSVLATRHEAATTPLSTRLSDGTDFISSEALAAAQKTVSTLTKMLATLSVAMGWDGTNHRELSCDNTGKLNVNATVNAGAVAPSAVSWKTGAYTVPASTMAVVVPKCANMLVDTNEINLMHSVSVSLNGNAANDVLGVLNYEFMEKYDSVKITWTRSSGGGTLQPFILIGDVAAVSAADDLALGTNTSIKSLAATAISGSVTVDIKDLYLSSNTFTVAGTAPNAISSNVSLILKTDTSSWVGTAVYDFYKSSDTAFSVPAGTDLDGDRYLVTEYTV